MVHFRRLYHTRILILAVLALSLLTSTAFASQLDDKRRQLNDVKAKIESTRRQIDDAKKREASVLAQIKQNDEKISQLQTEIFAQQQELDKTIAKRQAIEVDLNETQKRLDAAQAELAISRAKLEQRRAIYNKRLNSIYRNGKNNALEILLNSRDLGDLIERVSFISMIAENDGKLFVEIKHLTQLIQEKVNQIDAEKKALAEKRLALINEENRIAAVKNSIQARQNALQAELDAQKSLLAQIRNDKAQLEAAEDMLESTSNMIANQIRQLTGGGRQVSRSGGRPGKFIYPVSGPITSPFGWRYHPVLGYSRMHTGIDIAVPTGTPVHAAASGNVVIAGWMGGYGYAVVINHGGGITTLYGHNSSLAVHVGQSVSQGQVIAYAGSTGISTGPHVHFEVRSNGNPVNPMGWL